MTHTNMTLSNYELPLAFRLSAVTNWLMNNKMEFQAYCVNLVAHDRDFINVVFLKEYLGDDVVSRMDADFRLTDES